MRFLKIVLLSLFTVVGSFGVAEEEKPAPSGDKNSRAFQEKLQKMNRLDDQSKTHEEEFRKLVLKKRHSTDSKEKLIIINQMKETYAAYEKAMNELADIKKELRYRFPSEGEEALKSFSHVEKRSPEDLERTVDLGTTLSNAKMAVDEKYKVFMPPKRLKPKAEQKLNNDKQVPIEQRRIRLER